MNGSLFASRCDDAVARVGPFRLGRYGSFRCPGRYRRFRGGVLRSERRQIRELRIGRSTSIDRATRSHRTRRGRLAGRFDGSICRNPLGGFSRSLHSWIPLFWKWYVFLARLGRAKYITPMRSGGSARRLRWWIRRRTLSVRHSAGRARGGRRRWGIWKVFWSDRAPSCRP